MNNRLPKRLCRDSEDLSESNIPPLLPRSIILNMLRDFSLGAMFLAVLSQLGTSWYNLICGPKGNVLWATLIDRNFPSLYRKFIHHLRGNDTFYVNENLKLCLSKANANEDGKPPYGLLKRCYELFYKLSRNAIPLQTMLYLDTSKRLGLRSNITMDAAWQCGTSILLTFTRQASESVSEYGTRFLTRIDDVCKDLETHYKSKTPFVNLCQPFQHMELMYSDVHGSLFKVYNIQRNVNSGRIVYISSAQNPGSENWTTICDFYPLFDDNYSVVITPKWIAIANFPYTSNPHDGTSFQMDIPASSVFFNRNAQQVTLIEEDTLVLAPTDHNEFLCIACKLDDEKKGKNVFRNAFASYVERVETNAFLLDANTSVKKILEDASAVYRRTFSCVSTIGRRVFYRALVYDARVKFTRRDGVQERVKFKPFQAQRRIDNDIYARNPDTPVFPLFRANAGTRNLEPLGRYFNIPPISSIKEKLGDTRKQNYNWIANSEAFVVFSVSGEMQLIVRAVGHNMFVIVVPDRSKPLKLVSQ